MTRGVQRRTDSGDHVRQTRRRLIYSITLTGTGFGAALILTALTLDRPTIAVAGLALCLIALTAFRMAYEQATLHQQRADIGEQQRLVQAERSIFERDTERARRALHDRETELAEGVARDRARLCREIEDERDRMQTDFANKLALKQREAFQKGFEMGENGIGSESSSANVIYLPLGGNGATIMGTGTTHN